MNSWNTVVKIVVAAFVVGLALGTGVQYLLPVARYLGLWMTALIMLYLATWVMVHVILMFVNLIEKLTNSSVTPIGPSGIYTRNILGRVRVFRPEVSHEDHPNKSRSRRSVNMLPVQIDHIEQPSERPSEVCSEPLPPIDELLLDVTENTPTTSYPTRPLTDDERVQNAIDMGVKSRRGISELMEVSEWNVRKFLSRRGENEKQS